jgi:type II secretory pathway pseudopilin PulG
MMNNMKHLVTRGDTHSGLNETTMALLVALAMIVFLGLVLMGALIFLRNMRRARKEAESQLPLYEKRQSGHRRLTITALPYGKGRESVVVYQEKQDLLHNASSPPTSPVPEIRITFPDEVDDAGKRQSGRVVVVRVGEHSVGLEPVQDDLPAYQRDTSDRFDSLDLDRIGGLKEKDSKDYA